MAHVPRQSGASASIVSASAAVLPADLPGIFFAEALALGASFSAGGASLGAVLADAVVAAFGAAAGNATGAATGAVTSSASLASASGAAARASGSASSAPAHKSAARSLHWAFAHGRTSRQAGTPWSSSAATCTWRSA
eukprot:CAMPEP_0206804782 /NCGR_PEP_ID=MMETSP0975-20121206/3894_1 /ASSEMBLY_ACC=CAM_ASM_000399 /TAXON_ID=483370 /ORGANISM="non described non described, Strain CCMP2097" /LENGTH=137 /DNA_ID=CAMNT_0054346833 /DNA_START=804 /DNA_END=1215 /DNA_ORIENTATION=-